MPPTWLEDLKDLICRIYKEWGGNCADLPFAAGDQIMTLETTYLQNGAPAFPDEAARNSYLALLESTESHLDAGGGLAPDEDTRLRQLIISLQVDVSGTDT